MTYEIYDAPGSSLKHQDVKENIKTDRIVVLTGECIRQFSRV
jgi:hypothetical protein